MQIMGSNKLIVGNVSNVLNGNRSNYCRIDGVKWAHENEKTTQFQMTQCGIKFCY